MSGWKELRAERNQRSLLRLNRALPPIFPRAVLARALARPFVPPTPRLAIESYWSAHPIRADRLARALAARSQAPAGWTWRLGTAGAAYLSRFARHPRHTVNARRTRARICGVCGQPVYRFGWHIDLWKPDPTRTRSGTVLASSLGNSGMRQVARSDCCVGSKVGDALKAAGGCGGMPKLTIASRCSGSGANTETRLGRNCSIFGGCPTFR